MSGWLTIEEAAERVQRSPRTVYRWIDDQLLARYEIARDGKMVAGVIEGKLLEVDRQQRRRRGRPRKDDPGRRESGRIEA